MDTPPPAAVDEPSLMAIVTSAWSVEIDTLEYVPKGAGSYHWLATSRGTTSHFITVDDLDTKPWIGRDRKVTFAGLSRAYETASVLFHDDGLEAVVAPLRSVDGTVTVRLSDQYSVALFPFVAGAAGSWGEPIGERERAHLLHELAGLHRASAARQTVARRRPHLLADRDELHAALAALDRPWQGGEFAEPSRRALADNATRVREMLVRFDALAAALDASGAPLVVTHGEPHPGNLIHVDDGLRVIDWDTVALAEPERDLWMLDDGDHALDAYTELIRRPINREAIEFYRLAWTLSDISSFTGMFRAEHARTRWIESKWQGFVHLLEGGSSAPYGNREG